MPRTVVRYLSYFSLFILSHHHLTRISCDWVIVVYKNTKNKTGANIKHSKSTYRLQWLDSCCYCNYFSGIINLICFHADRDQKSWRTWRSFVVIHNSILNSDNKSWIPQLEVSFPDKEDSSPPSTPVVQPLFVSVALSTWRPPTSLGIVSDSGVKLLSRRWRILKRAEAQGLKGGTGGVLHRM